MRSYHCVALILFCLGSSPARADTELTGRWAGPFNGVQIEIPLPPGPFGWQGGQPRQVQTPRFVESTLTIDFETQRKGLAVGTWAAGKFTQKFVCAQINQAVWDCVDAGGRARVEVTSASELKVCYLDHREGAQGAGCALLRRVD